jgi:hypothetical protein
MLLPSGWQTMETVRTKTARQKARARGQEHFLTWLRELAECNRGGFLSDEDFSYQRAEKLDELLYPPRFLWMASLLGALLVGAVGGAITWLVMRDWRFAAIGTALAGAWGLTSLGRFLRERFVEIQLNERMKILIALLDHDLLTAAEYSLYEEQLAHGRLRHF